MSYTRESESPFSVRRLPVVAAVVLLHVGLIMTLQNGLTHRLIKMVMKPIQITIIQEDIVVQEPAPPPPFKIVAPPPFVPPPEIDIKLPQESASIAALDSVV